MQFFSRSLNANVVDALCQCGKLQSEHCSNVISLKGMILRESGHGSSENCDQFRWLRWVTEDELVEAFPKMITC